MSRKGVLLINLGTPDSPSVPDVRKYLREFLMDEYVIDLPFLTRWFLVNVIIATFRAPKSAKIYKELWTENGSPLLYYGLEVQKLLQDKLGDEYLVEFGMRYQNPPIKDAIERLKRQGVTDIKVIPMYPQWASSSTKSSIEKVKTELKKQNYSANVEFVENFVSNELFVKAFSELGGKYYNNEHFDHVIFSFHGIPERHILKDSDNGYCQLGDCCKKYTSKNRLCYRAQCYETARLIAKDMNLSESQYSVAFQSRLETRARDPWLKPYTDIVVEDLAKEGTKSVLAFSTSFVADCLETTIEVGEEFKEIFLENGGEKWQLVESLNTSNTWIECLEDLSKK